MSDTRLRKAIIQGSYKILQKSSLQEFERAISTHLFENGDELELRGVANADDEKRGLFLKNPKEKNACLYSFIPAIHCVNVTCESSCSNCLKELHTAIKCKNGCGRSFCSTKCMKSYEDNFHLLECQILLKYGAKCDIIMLTTLQLLLDASINEKHLIIYRNMSTHHDEFLKWFLHPDDNQEMFHTIRYFYCPIIQEIFGPDINMHGVMKAMLLVLINSAAMQNSYEEAIGIMLDPIFALINHNCAKRNCTLMWNDNRAVQLRSTKHILLGQELFVNYCPLSLPVVLRQKMLSENFFFICQCEWCQSDKKNGDRWLPIICMNCKEPTERGVALEAICTNKLKTIESITCTKCNSKINTTQIIDEYIKLVRLLLGGEVIDAAVQYSATSDQISILYDLSLNQDLHLIESKKVLKSWVKIFNESKEVIPNWSWPLQKVIEQIKQYYEGKDKKSFELVRYTVFQNTEIQCVDNSGMRLYDMVVALDRWLQYHPEEDNEEKNSLCLRLAGGSRKLLYDRLGKISPPYNDLTEMIRQRGGDLEAAINNNEIERSINECLSLCGI